MFVKTYSQQVAANAVARTAESLSGSETCSITMLHPPMFQKLACTLAGFADGVVRVRTNLRLSPGMSVQIGVGHAMIIFGTVGSRLPSAAGAGVVQEIAVNTAVIRHAADA